MNLIEIHCIMAFRNVLRAPRRTMLTVAAISFGLFCLIVFQALKQGLHHEMISGTVGLDSGALQVHAADYEVNLTTLLPLDNPARVTALLRREGLNASMRLKTAALVLAGSKSSTVILSGILPEAESNVTFIHEKIVSGGYLGGPKDIVIGSALAQGLGVSVGDTVNLMVQSVFGTPVSGRFVVGGIYKTSLGTFDRSHAYLPLAAAQELVQEEVVTEVAAAADPGAAEAIGQRLRSALPYGSFKIWSWQQISPDVLQLIELNNATMNLLIIIVFVIVAMGIANTMTTVIFERFREIGTMTAIGATPGGIVGLIVAESFFLGAFASVLGTLAAMAACAYLSEYGIDLGHFVSANQYFADSHVLKGELLPGDLVLANIITMATAVIAGIYPAVKAANLEPVEAIAHI